MATKIRGFEPEGGAVLWQRHPRPHVEPSSASVWCWRTRVGTKFFGEHSLTLKVSCKNRHRRPGGEKKKNMFNILVAASLCRARPSNSNLPPLAVVGTFEEVPEVGDSRSRGLVFFSTRRIFCSRECA